jgi:callose synthase
LSLPLIAVYFGEMGLRRGFVRFMEMIITLGPVFFISKSARRCTTTLLHGEAQYKARGREFKITRETLVLLYKAYASSHYRKAFELVLSFVYLTFGAFNICDENPIDNKSTYFLFCPDVAGLWRPEVCDLVLLSALAPV